jgi:hypothetical protein
MSRDPTFTPAPQPGVRRTSPPYRREGDHFLLELRLSSAEQLFDMRDPAPFLERDLDPDAEDYLLECLREVPRGSPIKILIHAPRAAGITQEAIAAAIAHFFSYRRWASHLRLREMFRLARVTLLIGLVFLIVCLTASELIKPLPWGLAGEILSQGLFIVSWVAMWRPLELFLFDWWPIVRLERLHARLATALVEVQPV